MVRLDPVNLSLQKEKSPMRFLLRRMTLLSVIRKQSILRWSNALGGQVVHISPTSKDYINPMDINMDYSDDDNPLGVKSDFILSLM